MFLVRLVDHMRLSSAYMLQPLPDVSLSLASTSRWSRNMMASDERLVFFGYISRVCRHGLARMQQIHGSEGHQEYDTDHEREKFAVQLPPLITRWWQANQLEMPGIRFRLQYASQLQLVSYASCCHIDR